MIIFQKVSLKNKSLNLYHVGVIFSNSHVYTFPPLLYPPVKSKIFQKTVWVLFVNKRLFGFSLWKIFYFYRCCCCCLTSLKHKTKECTKVCRKDIEIGVGKIYAFLLRRTIFWLSSHQFFFFFLWKSNFMIVVLYIRNKKKKVFLCWVKIDDYLSKGELFWKIWHE